MARLLLIEDDDTTREVLALLLRADGWEVFEAAGGEAAVLLAASDRPDVVLSDLQMPGIHGTDLAVALRERLGSDVPLLAMTATRLPGPPDGFDALLIKPFDAAVLRAAVGGLGSVYTGPDRDGAPVLAVETFDRLRASMPAAQLRTLYEFALDDAAGRVTAMDSTTDDAVFRREAHALKGSCGMVGASRLRRLAQLAEEQGQQEFSTRRKTISDFREEILAVRRMLEKLLIGDI